MAAGKPGSGSGGPWRGSVDTIHFSVATLSIGTRNQEIGRFNVATGSEFHLYRAQSWASSSGVAGDTTAAARATIFSDQTIIVRELPFASGSSTFGTLVATTATSAGVPAGRAVPIIGPANLRATASSQLSQTGPNELHLYLEGFWKELPSSLRAVTE